MPTTPLGAHLLLQDRVKVLNNDLTTVFRRWYPGFGGQQSAQIAA